MPRFYLPNADFFENELILSDAGELHHLKNVLRVHKGERVELFNGRGGEVSGVVEEINLKLVRIRLMTSVQEQAFSQTKIILACAIPKKAKFEYILEKATELGVDEIFPVQTKRTEVKLSAERAAQKLKRYQSVAVNAAKQCGRSQLPVVHPVTSFKEILATLEGVPLKIIASLVGERRAIAEILNQKFSTSTPSAVAILIGPEGDFTQEETALALQNAWVPATLGPTVLKVDTAAIAVVTVVRFMGLQNQSG